MLTVPNVALAVAVVLMLAVAVVVVALCRSAARNTAYDGPDPVGEAYNTLPAGRPELAVDTVTGAHDRYPQMTDSTRDIVIAYCERMWQHTPTIRPAAPEES